MKITIVSVGKIKEKFMRDAILEYSKRLAKYCKLEIIEVADEKMAEHAPEAVRKAVLQREAERILRYLRDDVFVVALEISGKSLSSEELAEKIETLGIKGVSHIQFVIGGSVGLAKEISKRADFSLSFSKMTFPHQLMRIILLEQIYRSFRIISGEPYHK